LEIILISYLKINKFYAIIKNKKNKLTIIIISYSIINLTSCMFLIRNMIS